MKKHRPKWEWWSWGRGTDPVDGSFGVQMALGPFTGTGQTPVVNNTIIDTASGRSISGSGAANQSYPSVNRFKVHAIRGHVMPVILGSTFTIADLYTLHMGIYKSSEGVQNYIADPAALQDANLDWLWISKKIFVVSNTILTSNFNLLPAAWTEEVHVKTIRTVRANERLCFVATILHNVAVTSLYSANVTLWLRCLVSEIA